MKDFILELDRSRMLRFGFKAHRLIKSKFKLKNLEELTKIDIEDIPDFVCFGLLWEDEKLTQESVEELLDKYIPPYSMIEIMMMVLDALAAHLGIQFALTDDLAELTEGKKALADEPEKVVEDPAEKKVKEKKKGPKKVITSKNRQKKRR